MKDADLILYVVDASTNLDENDGGDHGAASWKTHDRTFLNKSDLTPLTTAEDIRAHVDKDCPVISISAREQKGIDVFTEQIREMFFRGEVTFNDEVYITNIRHKTALQEALSSLHLVEQSIADGMPEDFLLD